MIYVSRWFTRAATVFAHAFVVWAVVELGAALGSMSHFPSSTSLTFSFMSCSKFAILSRCLRRWFISSILLRSFSKFCASIMRLCAFLLLSCPAGDSVASDTFKLGLVRVTVPCGAERSSYFAPAWPLAPAEGAALLIVAGWLAVHLHGAHDRSQLLVDHPIPRVCPLPVYFSSVQNGKTAEKWSKLCDECVVTRKMDSHRIHTL